MVLTLIRQILPPGIFQKPWARLQEKWKLQQGGNRLFVIYNY